MHTLARNSANDLFVSAGGLAIAKDANAQSDIIRSIILTQQGELQFDANGGIDYFGTVFQNARYIDLWAAEVRTKIKKLSWVESITDFTYEFNRETSSVIWTMTVNTTNGNKLTITPRNKIPEDKPLRYELDWNSIYNKPRGAEEAAATVKRMKAGRTRQPEDGLTRASTWMDAKKAINDIVLRPNGVADRDATDDIRFSVTAEGDGATVEGGGLGVTATGEWMIDWGDGNYEYVSGNTNPEHTYETAGDYIIVLSGAISKIESTTDGTCAIRGVTIKGFGVGERAALTEIGNSLFYGNASLKTVEVKSPLVKIGTRAFFQCTALASLSWMPETISQIGEWCFAETGIKSIEGLSDGLTALPDYCFNGCTSLTSIVGLPTGLETIGEGCFAECAAVKEVYIPSTVTAIDASAFNGCCATEGSSVRCDAVTPPSVDATFFSAGAKAAATLYVPNGSLAAYQGATGWEDFSNIETVASITFTLEGVPAGTKLLGGTSCIKSGSPWTVDYGDGTPVKVMASAETGIPEHIYAEGGVSIAIKVYGSITEIASAVDANDATTSTSYPIICTNDKTKSEYLTGFDFDNGMPLKKIGSNCFCGCENLSSIKSFGETSGCEFGNRAFYRCKSLTSLSWLPDVGDAMFGSYCFAVCTSLTSNGASYIASATLMIPAYCFYGCTGIETVPWSNLSFGEGCFMASGVTNLTDLEINDVPAYCFAECKNLTKIGDVRGTASFGAHCFDGCENLAAFDWNPAHLGVSVTLGEYCFAHCTLLANLSDFGDAPITAIPAYCFSGCTALKNLSGMGDSVISIGEAAFENCTSLYTLQGISKSLVTVGTRAFDGCSQIKRIDWLPKTVESICSKAFRGCPIECIAIACYKKVEDSEVVTVPTLASDAFGTIDYSSVPLYVMPQALDAYKSASVWQNFSAKTRYVKLTINGLDTAYGIIGGGEIAIRNENESRELSQAAWIVDWGDGNYDYLDTISAKSLPWHKYKDSEKYTITVFGDIRSIDGEQNGGVIFKATSATAAKNKLNKLIGLEVNADMRLEAIGIGSFSETGLEHVKLAFRETSDKEKFASSIGKYAFYGCKKLVKVEMPNNRLAADIVAAYAFDDNKGLTTLIGFGGVRQLGEGVFSGCSSLKSTIGLGSDLKLIGSKAFLNTDLQCIEMVAKTPPAIQADTFPDHKIPLYVPKNVVKAYRDATNWSDFEDASQERYIKSRYIKIGIGDDFVGIVNGTRSGTEIVPIDSSTVTTKDASEGESEFYVDWGDGSPVEFVYGSSLPYHEYKNTVAEETEEETSSEPQPVFVTLGGNIVSISGMIGHASEGNTYFPFISGDATAQSVNVTNLPDFNSFGECCFKGCTNLTEIETDGDIKIGSNNGLSIGGYAFAGCTSLKITEALSYVKSVGECAFQGCISIESLSPLTQLEGIGKAAFEECTGLTAITTKNDNHTITAIGEGAFRNCTALTSLNGLSHVNVIDIEAFKDCSALTSLEGLSTGNMVSLNKRAFEGCIGLVSLKGAKQVKSIGDEAFLGCTGLKTTRGVEKAIGSTDISSDIHNLNLRCFSVVAAYDMKEDEDGNYVPDPTSYTYTCPLEEVVIDAPPYPEETGYYIPTVKVEENRISAFKGMTTNNEGKYTIPLLVPANYIGAYRSNESWSCFESIFPLPSASGTVGDIKFKLENVSAGTSVLANCMEVTCDTMYMIDWGDGQYEYVKNGETFPSHTYEKTKDNYIIGLSGSITKIASSSTSNAAIRLSGDGALTGFSVVAGASLTEIGDYAFYNCTSLSSVTIASGVNTITTIGQSAFYGCTALTSLDWLPTTVTSLGSACFRASGLTSLSRLSSITGLTALPDNCFYGCLGFTAIDTLPSSLKTIGEYCFDNCTNVTSIVIPSAVTSIGTYAFNGCCQTSGNTVTCNAATPPTAQSSFFSSTAYSEAILIVPSGKMSAYESATNWSQFKSIFPAALNTQDINTRLTLSGVSNGTTINLSNVRVTTSSSRGWMVAWGNGKRQYVKSGEYAAPITYESADIAAGGDIILCGEITAIGRLNTSNPMLTIVGGGNLTGIAVESDSSLQNFASSAWQASSDLTTIDIRGKKFTNIYDRCFADCPNVTTIRLPETLQSISYKAFDKDTTLHGCCETLGSEIRCDAVTMPSISSDSFSTTARSQTVLTVPSESLQTYKSSSSWGQFSNIFAIDGSDGIKISVRDGSVSSYTVAINKSKWEASGVVVIDYGDNARHIVNATDDIPSHSYSGDSTYTITIQGQITQIKNSTSNGTKCISFNGISNSATIYLDIGEMAPLTTIGEYAFSSIPLHSLIVQTPNVATIGKYAFISTKVSHLDLEATSVKILPERCFYDTKAKTTLKLPHALEEIGLGCFGSCSLGNITLPASLKSIGCNAFTYNFTNWGTIIRCEATTPPATPTSVPSGAPPSTSTDVFSSATLSNAFVYVPSGCIPAYRGAATSSSSNQWRNFAEGHILEIE